MLYEESKPMSTERVQIDGVWYDKITIDRVTVRYEKVPEQPPVKADHATPRRGRPPKVTHDDAGAES
jgi:hypothetical protein